MNIILLVDSKYCSIVPCITRCNCITYANLFTPSLHLDDHFVLQSLPPNYSKIDSKADTASGFIQQKNEDR
jgi:hypothetical protein